MNLKIVLILLMFQRIIFISILKFQIELHSKFTQINPIQNQN